MTPSVDGVRPLSTSLPVMTEQKFSGPRNDPWTVAIFASAELRIPLGTGIVLDSRRILTCRHVVEGKYDNDRRLIVNFPKAGLPRSERREVAEVRPAPESDIAILELHDPVPPEVPPAPLRAPRESALVGTQWWTFGFPADSEFGAEASGTVGANLAFGWIRLDTSSRYAVRPGFSGSGLWSVEFQAVVGLVGQARKGGENPGDAQAVTIFQAAQELRDERLFDLTAWSLDAAGESAHEAWGWSLTWDDEARKHWRPRARGVSNESEVGYRFRGRRAALTAIVRWLQRPRPDRYALLVTGSPGVGKSAVLGRVVTTADKDIRAQLPSGDDNVRAPLNSIAWCRPCCCPSSDRVPGSAPRWWWAAVEWTTAAGCSARSEPRSK
jgi:hypothetical protein